MNEEENIIHFLHSCCKFKVFRDVYYVIIEQVEDVIAEQAEYVDLLDKKSQNDSYKGNKIYSYSIYPHQES